MNIAVFVTYLPPHVGGIEVVADNQITALAGMGHNVEVVTSACGAVAGRETRKHIIIWRIAAWNYFERKMSVVFPIFAPSLIRHSYTVVKSADVVHAHDAFYLTSLAAAFWCAVLRKPLILTQHVDMVPHPNKFVMLIQRLVYATTGAFIFRVSRYIIVLNSRVSSFLANRSISNKKIYFLPNGIDTDALRPSKDVHETRLLRKQFGLPKDKKIALFVGRFVPKKGFDKLLKLPKIDDTVLAFAGGKAPHGHDRKDHIFLGKVSRRDIPSLYRAADIFILPSSGEGFPMTVQEAMASGLAVVTTDDPAYEPYNLTNKEILFIDPTPKNLHIALTHHSLKNIGAAARAYAWHRFGLETHSELLLKLYQKAQTL